jgi:hypothetical protein
MNERLKRDHRFHALILCPAVHPPNNRMARRHIPHTTIGGRACGHPAKGVEARLNACRWPASGS